MLGWPGCRTGFRDLRQCRAIGVLVALVVGQHLQAPAEEGDVHPGVVAGQRREAIGGDLLTEAEVLGKEGTGCRDVLDGQ